MDKRKYNIILTIVFGLMVTIPLYFRGLYFEVDLLPTVIGIYVIFGVWSVLKIKNKDYNIFKDPTDYLFAGIVFMYGMSIFYGVNKRAALFELFRHMLYFIIFVLAKELSTEEKHKKAIMNIVLLGGLFVSIIGIGTATGTWNYNGAMLGTRLSSTFQYPNTLAAYVASLYFLGLTMLIYEEKKPIKSIYGLILGTFLFSLILTYSRAMWLIFPIIGLLYFIFIPNNRKLESVIYIVSSAILSLPASLLFARGLENPSNAMWKYYLMASIGTGLVIYIMSLGEKLYRKVPVKILLIMLGLLIITISSATVYVINATTEIELANDTSEPKSSYISRNTSKTLPLSNYTLEVDYKVENNSEAPFAGRVRVYNIDNEKKATELAIENIVETLEGTANIQFSTPEDSVGIRILLDNYYGNTNAKFKEIKLIDEYNNKTIYNVPLKYKYIPENIVSRVSSLGVGGTSADARLIFMKDGLSIIKDYPILGTGGGGWVTLYHGYQSYPYWSTQAHNYALQLWIEIGTLGLLIFLVLLLIITVFSIKSYLKEEKIDNKLILVGLYFTLLAMFVHAIIDFDMSLPSYAIVFWTIMGVLTKAIQYDFNMDNSLYKKLKKVNPKLLSYVSLILILGMLLNTVQIQASIKYRNRGADAVEAMDTDNILLNFEKAWRLDKYNPDYLHDLINIYMKKYEDTKDQNYPVKAYEASQRFLELSKHNPISYGSIATFLMSVGKLEDGLALLDRAVELQPMVTEQYISRGNGYLAIFRHYYQNEEYDKAREILERALKIKEDLKEVSKRTVQPLSTSIDLIYKIGEIQYYLDNFDSPDAPFAMGYNLDFAYYFDIDANNDGNIDILYTTKPEDSRINYEYMDADKDKFIRLTNYGEVYGYIYLYGLKLEPDTEYLVQVKARGTLKPETMDIYAWSNGSEDPNQGSLIGVPITEGWTPYIFEFITDSDVEMGKQRIIIQHNGKDTGYIDIKELAIFKKDKK